MHKTFVIELYGFSLQKALCLFQNYGMQPTLGVSLVAPLVENLPAIQDTLVQFWVGEITWRRDRLPTTAGFPDSSVGKESTCNAGDPGSIPGSGRSTGEGIDYPLQYFWASLVAQLVKNPPAMQETWVQSLGWEDPLEKGKATHSSTLDWRIPWTEEPGRLYSPWAHKESDMTE